MLSNEDAGQAAGCCVNVTKMCKVRRCGSGNMVSVLEPGAVRQRGCGLNISGHGTAPLPQGLN